MRFTVYLSYIIFQLFSHKQLFDDANEEIMKSRRYDNVEYPFKQNIQNMRHLRWRRPANVDKLDVAENGESEIHTAPNSDAGADITGQPRSESPAPESTIPEGTEEEIPSMSFPLTIGLLVVVTVVCSIY